MLKNLRNLKHTSRKPFTFKRQMALLFFGIFGFMVAGAWVLAFNTLINKLFFGWNEIIVYFCYAITITLVCLFLIWLLVIATEYWQM